MKIDCEVYEVELANEDGKITPGVRAECDKCSHYTESYGRGDLSRKRCLILLRNNCPMGEKNYYTESTRKREWA